MESGVEETQAHAGSVRFWRDRLTADGLQFTATHDQERQRLAIESLLLSKLSGHNFFENGLDFGCGHGRFIPLLSKFCGHVWAADILLEALEVARRQASNVSILPTSWPLSLPFINCKLDFLWAGLVFQHITDDRIFKRTLEALGAALKSGARVLILDNAVDRASHVKARAPEIFAAALRLSTKWRVERVTINTRADDHWLLEGVIE